MRRPPFGDLAPGAHDMKREYHVLSLLADVYRQAPKAFLFCGDHTVAGSDFFVMEYRSGVTIRDDIPSELAACPHLGLRIGRAFVDAVAELHSLSPDACGLGGIGRPLGFAERQVTGWTKRWELARPENAPTSMDQVAHRLAASIPKPQRVSLLHNDLHLGNCQFDPRDPDRVASIFDWDMATTGDPLIDFASLLAYWPEESDFPSASSSKASATLTLPTRSEVVGRYAEVTGLDLGEIDWYHAFARWRIAIIMQQLYNRWSQGNASDSRASAFGKNVPVLAEAAQCLLDGRHWTGG
jgi:aminoglycoside phosphotransferase (APT) family kinase protein